MTVRLRRFGVEELRVRADDVARALDLEDESATINVKLGSGEAVWIVEDGLEGPGYSVTFYGAPSCFLWSATGSSVSDATAVNYCGPF